MDWPQVGTLVVRATIDVVVLIVVALFSWPLLRGTKMFDAYAEQIAKDIARHQSLDKLVEETKRVTDAAETIKASLSHENWDWQARWTAKRDVYIRVAEALGNLRDALCALQISREYLSKDLGPVQKHVELHEAAVQQVMEAKRRWASAIDIAPLLIASGPYCVMLELKYHDARWEDVDFDKVMDANTANVRRVWRRFTTAARADLGYEAMDVQAMQTAVEARNRA